MQSELEEKLTNNIELELRDINIGSETPYKMMETQQSTNTLETKTNNNNSNQNNHVPNQHDAA